MHCEQVHEAIRANPGGEKKEKEAYSGEKQEKRKARKLTYDERKRNVKVRCDVWLVCLLACVLACVACA